MHIRWAWPLQEPEVSPSTWILLVPSWPQQAQEKVSLSYHRLLEADNFKTAPLTAFKAKLIISMPTNLLMYPITRNSIGPWWKLISQSFPVMMITLSLPWMHSMRNWNSMKILKWRRIRLLITYNSQRRAVRSCDSLYLRPRKRSRRSRTRISSTKRSL